MHQLGLLPLGDLRLDAPQFRSLPGCGCALAAGGANQLTNGGVKALVDAVCSRWLAGRFRAVPSRAGAAPAINLGALRAPALHMVSLGVVVYAAGWHAASSVVRMRLQEEAAYAMAHTCGDTTRRCALDLR